MEVSEQEVGVEYAGFWIRLGAYILDGIILNIISFILGFILGFGLAFSSASLDAISAMSYVFGIILGLVYYVGFWTWWGQTPGKMAVRIKIVRTNGAPIGVGGSIVRYIGYFVSSIILLIGFLWIAFDRRKQGIHDKIADTYVVKLPPKR